MSMKTKIGGISSGSVHEIRLVTPARKQQTRACARTKSTAYTGNNAKTLTNRDSQKNERKHRPSLVVNNIVLTSC